MKNQFKRSILLLFFGILLLGSYTYICHHEYLINSASVNQLQEQVQENAYHLPDVEIVKYILDFIFTNLTSL